MYLRQFDQTKVQLYHLMLVEAVLFANMWSLGLSCHKEAKAFDSEYQPEPW